MLFARLKQGALSVLAALALLSAFAPPVVHATTLTYLFSNNATTTLAAPITASSPSLQVLSGAGALFPIIPQPGYAFIITMVKNGAPTTKEVIVVTGHTSGSDNFTGLIRGQDGTSALTWNAGDAVALLVTALGMNSMVQFPELQAQAQNYANDTGAANAYSVTLSPAMNSHQVGTPIRWKAAHTNTAFPTFNDGFGAASMVTPQRQAVQAGQIIAGGIFECIWDGTVFVTTNVTTTSFSQVLGTASNAQVPLAAVQQYQSNLSIAPSQLSALLNGGSLVSGIALAGSPTTTTQASGDTSTKIATTAFANPGALITGGGPWWERRASGALEAWGTLAYSGSGTPVTVSLPVTFASIEEVNANVQIGGNQPGVHALGTTTVQFDMNGLGGTAQTIYWRVIGR